MQRNGEFTCVWTTATRGTVSVFRNCRKKHVPFWWLLHQFFLARSSCMNVHTTNVGLLQKHQSVDLHRLIRHPGVWENTEKVQQTCSTKCIYIYVCTWVNRQDIPARTVAEWFSSPLISSKPGSKLLPSSWGRRMFDLGFRDFIQYRLWV